MKLNFNRDVVLIPLQAVHNVVERRQSLPILGNILVTVEKTQVLFTATDMEVESVFHVPADNPETGQITIPARKFLDIVRSLPAGTDINLNVTEKQAILRAGRSRFSLSTMSASEFPNIGEFEVQLSVTIEAKAVRELIAMTQFAMAHNDVRYYLNGLLLEIAPNRIRAVATDGHRLAMADADIELAVPVARQVIVPRKGVTELMRLLEACDGTIELVVGENHLQAKAPTQQMTTKLIDGKYPDYERVLPRSGDKIVLAGRETLRNGLARTAILSNEKFRGVRLALKSNQLTALAHNPEQEEAEETMEVTYDGPELEIGFNANYLLDVLQTVRSEQVRMEFSDANSSCLITPESDRAKFVVMPMRL